jgi:ATP-dependent Lon protease
MSKVVFVFTYNDSSLIHPILKDRIHEIKIAPFTEEEKIVIGTKYLLKEVGSNIGFKDGDIICPNEVMRFMVEEYCKNDKGVRHLKRCIETILMKLNTARYYKQTKYKTISKETITLPYTLSETVVKELVKKKENDESMHL